MCMPNTVSYTASLNRVDSSFALASARLSAALMPLILVCPSAY
jgi:hypothetical protein